MCTRGDSKAAKRARQATRPPVPTSGSEVSARSRASNALSVPIVGSFQSPTTSYAGTCQVPTPKASPSSSASTRCFRTRPASSLPSISTRPAGATMPRRFLKPVAHLDLPAAVERSRSGRGAHVWFFFEEAIPAALARRLGSHVLTETMEGRPEIGLDSYDRLFPSQDTMPRGGFGNLIALPLQRAARKHDNTVFLDGAFVPWPDQWAFLASVRKIAGRLLHARLRLSRVARPGPTVRIDRRR